MLTIKTYLAPSSVHGIGLFAAEDIPAHTVVWKFNNHIDKVFSELAFLRICQGLDDFGLKHFLNSCYRRAGRYFYLTDNARFINHSDRLDNIIFADDNAEVTVRDINAGEELLENYYHAYDSGDFFFQELFDPDPYTYVLALEMNGHYNADCKNLS